VPAIVAEPLKVVSRRDPLRVPPGTSLTDALAAIRQAGTGDSVFVTDERGFLLGVLTERDIFGLVVLGEIDLVEPVESMMTTDPQRLHLDDPVSAAIELMQTGRYRNVPLVDDDDCLVGVVRPQDILKYLAEAFPTELLNLPPRPHQQMEQPEGG
jgi:CBS domain-containing protein